jgi:adenylate kinase family enzyme
MNPRPSSGTTMTRVAIIGNAAGGKSTLADKISAARGLPCIEVDKLLWLEGWKLAPADIYEASHSAAIAGHKWDH